MVIRVVKNLLAYILSVHPSLTRVQNLLNQARDFWSYTPTLKVVICGKYKNLNKITKI